MPPGRAACWRVDPNGRCQVAPCPSHGDLLRLLDLCHCDHVLHYPLDAPNDAYRFQCYVSQSRPGAFLVYTDGPQRPPPSSTELAHVYRWAMQHRGTHAYPCLRLTRLRPSPNESHTDANAIATWCDAHTDAFTRFRCNHLLDPTGTRRRRAPPSTGSPATKRPRAP